MQITLLLLLGMVPAVCFPAHGWRLTSCMLMPAQGFGVQRHVCLQEVMRYGKVATALVARKPSLLGFELAGEGNTGLQLLALLNPLSRTAQRMAPVLQWVQAWLGPGLKVVLNPVPDLDKPPLNSYYRFVLPALRFSGLPAEL